MLFVATGQLETMKFGEERWADGVRPSDVRSLVRCQAPHSLRARGGNRMVRGGFVLEGQRIRAHVFRTADKKGIGYSSDFLKRRSKTPTPLPDPGGFQTAHLWFLYYAAGG